VRPGTVLSTNTSGLSCTAQAAALPPALRRGFLGTHFFNPPRYLKLLEVIPVPDTDPEVTARVTELAERTLGKRVVVAKDTPNFIANRVGAYGVLVTLRVMDELGLGVDAVDAITGPAMGRPRSATFRTLDLVGLDTLYHVARNTAAVASDPEERAVMALPGYVEQMVERGWLGEKSGQGFYRRVPGAGGASEILTLDLGTLEYRPRARVTYPSLEQVRAIEDPGARLRALIAAPDPAGKLAWETLSRVLEFCAARVEEIAGGDVNAVDRAMRWGFSWELGPFETWNAVGVAETVARIEAEGRSVPEWVKGVERFPVDRRGETPLSFVVCKAEGERVVRSGPGATLVDLGDDVLGLEFHSPKQALGQDYVTAARGAAEEVRRRWRGLVISGSPTASAPNFCVGANVLLVLLGAQEEDWDEIERTARDFQGLNSLLRSLERPVVVAPYGFALGGGCEVAMACARTVAAAETYLGLTETALGLIPAGGGCAEMARRCAALLPAGESQLPNRPELIGFVGRAFEAIGTARVSTSAAEARDLGYLRPADEIVMNGDHLLHRAKEAVLELDRAGYRPPPPVRFPVAGPEGRAVLELAAYNLKNSGYATDYDVHVARRLAYVLTGGDLPAGTEVPESYLHDLEREAFLHLCGQPQTQARMAHFLQHGRPLRN
jgi:3-hydroxyacyl-CoA dehydrogenase